MARHTMGRRTLTVLVIAAMVAVTLGAQPAPASATTEGPPPPTAPDRDGSTDRRGQRPSEQEFREVEAAAEDNGTARAIIELPIAWSPEGQLSAQRRSQQRAEIARAQGRLKSELRGAQHRVLHEYVSLPSLAVELSPEAIDRLRGSDSAASIQVDQMVAPTLDDSVPLIGAADLQSLSKTGVGQAVAIVDTGVESAHPMFAGRVIDEVCFNTVTSCPNGKAFDDGPGAGEPCAIAACDHGTHVAGIAAGASADLHGVAPAAGIVAVQVFHITTSCDALPSPCVRASYTDINAALDWLHANYGSFSAPLAAVNMSLGGGKYTAACDGDLPTTTSAINQLAVDGAATVISSGNSGYIDGVGAPGCISSAVTVGSTTKSDGLSSFSNSADMVDVLAPGSSIQSAVTGGLYGYKSGTSMAAPHVAGAYALLKEASPTSTLSELLDALKTNGQAVTDTRTVTGPPPQGPTNLVKSRIDLLPTLQELEGLCPLDDGQGNGSSSTARLLVGGQSNDGVLCGVNDDWYVIPGIAGGALSVTVTANDMGGDVDIDLFGATPTGQPLASATTAGTSEQLVFPVTANEDHYLRVYNAGADTRYGVVTSVDACPGDDRYENDDYINQFTVMSLPATKDGVSCPTDTNGTDMTQVFAVAGEELQIDLHYASSVGPLALHLYDWNEGESSASAIASGTSGDDMRSIRYTPTVDDEFQIQVYGATAAVPYRLVIRQPVSDSPPTVGITAPADGSVVSGEVAITANASDDVGVTQVEFFVDGVSLGVDADAGGGWGVRWDSDGVSASEFHTIKAVARDSAAQDTESAVVSVAVVDLAGCPCALSPNPVLGSSVPGRAVDGDLGTFWQPTAGPGPVGTDPKTFQVSLPVATVLTGLDFSWYSVDHRFVDYTIETSLDGSTWNTVATVVGNTSASYTDSFAPVEAAHVRIRSTLWTGGATWGPALREVAFR
jgi:hypothetical protein